MFNSESVPLDQVLQFPIDHSAIEDLLYNPFFFSVDDFREWGWRYMSTLYWVFRCWGKFDDIENRVESAHRRGKLKSVCAISDFLDDVKRA